MCKRSQFSTYLKVNALSDAAQSCFFLETIVVDHYLY